MKGQALNSKYSFNVVDVDISNDLFWYSLVMDLTEAAGKKLEPLPLATLYKA